MKTQNLLFVVLFSVIFHASAFAQINTSSSYFENHPWDQIIGEARNLSELDRLTRLKNLLAPYIHQRPEFQFSWGSEGRVKAFTDIKLDQTTFSEIYKRASTVPKGLYISTDPFDSNSYGTTFNVIRLPQNGRTFVDLMAIVPLLGKLGYMNVISGKLYSDLTKIGVNGAIWGGATWSFIFAPVAETEVWSPEMYKEFLDKNPERRAESYDPTSLEQAYRKLAVGICTAIF